MVNVNAQGVLLLNVSYEPLRAISIRHAVDLLLRGAAEEVEGIAACLKTASAEFIVPSVLRLKRYVNVPQRNVQPTARNVKKRDSCTCIYCGVALGDKQSSKILAHADFTIDHIIPVSKGGKNTWGNLACACWKCNNRKANRAPHDAGMKLLWEPKRPRVNYLIASGDIPKEWKAYLKV